MHKVYNDKPAILEKQKTAQRFGKKKNNTKLKKQPTYQ